MPFVSEAQRRKCYVMQRQMNEEGLVSNWDCKKFGEKKIPGRVTPRKSRRVKKTPTKVGQKEKEKVFQGVRGGKFVIRKNRKVYV
jgi:hypothetical protein